MNQKMIGHYIITDPEICHGKPTFRDTRIMVWQVLEQVASGMAWETIEAEWRGKVSKDAIAEAIRLASQAFTEHADEYAVELAPARSFLSSTSFPPVITSGSTILIVGSMPGQISLCLNQYYAHPRNLFWKFMGDLVGVNVAADYDERIRHLQRTGLALWDTLKHSERSGSLDANIVPETEKPNDFPTLLADYPAIRAICFNGKKSEQVFRKRVLPFIPDAQLQKLDLIGLPSTSPANAGLTYEQKLADWRAILDYLPALPTM